MDLKAQISKLSVSDLQQLQVFIQKQIDDAKDVPPQTLSFGILDDCSWGRFGLPYHETLEKDANLTKVVQSILDRHCEKFTAIDVHVSNHQQLYDHQTGLPTLTAEEVVRSLNKKKYFAWNRVNKYYVVAFALDYTRFEIFSKDCDKQLINWHVQEQDKAMVVHQIDDPDYNENPVVKMLRNLHD